MGNPKCLTGSMLVLLAACVSGCVTEGPLAPMRGPFRHGESSLLRWNVEMSYRNGGAMNVESGKLEFAVSARDVVDGNGILLSVRGTRHVGGWESMGQFGLKTGEMMDTDRPASDCPSKADSYAEMKRNLHAVAASARLSPNGQLTFLNAHGIPYDLTKARDGVPKEDLDYFDRHVAPYVFPTLTETLAYLPPPGAEIGRAWTVHRDYVTPGHQFAYYMMTSGGGPAKEESTCRCEWIEPTASGRVAVVSISGTRVPEYQPGQTKRTPSLTVKGELRYNLDSGRILRQRIESVPQWADPNEAKQWQTKFVDTLSTEDLKP